jgi:hypothetical protein
MKYSLKFLPTALKEWKKLDNAIQSQFKKKLSERLEKPHVLPSPLRRDRTKPGRKPENPPHQPLFVIGGFFGNDVVAQNCPVDVPDILPRQLHINAGNDTAPVVSSQGRLEPLGHAVALDNE